MGGDVSVDSAPGQGAPFHLHIASQEERVTRSIISTGMVAAGQGYRIRAGLTE
jgi:hypothetical protein